MMSNISVFYTAINYWYLSRNKWTSNFQIWCGTKI